MQYFGREVEPGNALYREAAPQHPRDHRATRGQAPGRGLSSVGPASPNFDPIAENWLDAPMDFENEVLANEMRMSLMASAGLTEQDLIPNPMPALAQRRDVQRRLIHGHRPRIPADVEHVVALKTVGDAASRSHFLAAMREYGQDAGPFTLERLQYLMAIEEHFQALLLYDQIEFLRRRHRPRRRSASSRSTIQRIFLEAANGFQRYLRNRNVWATTRDDAGHHVPRHGPRAATPSTAS